MAMALRIQSPFVFEKEQVQKAVQLDDTRAISKEPTGFAFSQMVENFLANGQKGIPKPSLITFDTLRRMSRTLPLVGVAKNKLKHQVMKVKWDLVVTDDNRAQNSHRDEIFDLLQFPNRNRESFRTFMNKLIDDILDLDAGVVEKVRNRNGKIVELWNRDGTTILPVYNKYGVAGDPAYIQVMPDNPMPVASWSNDDMIYMMQNPQVQTAYYGYGLSPVEMVIMSATSLLMAEDYNMMWFDRNTVPPMIVNLGEGVTPDQLKRFQAEWMGALQGTQNAWKSMVVASKDLTVEKIREMGKDMEFMDYYMWLAKIIISAFEMSPQDLGITFDVNRATAEVQQDLSKNGGLRTLLTVIREYINNEIIADFGYQKEFTFEWLDLDLIDADTQSVIDDRNLRNGSTTINEVRLSRGEFPVKGGEKPYIYTATGPQWIDGNSIEDATDEELAELRTPIDDENVTDRDLENEQDPKDEDADNTQTQSPQDSQGDNKQAS